MAVVCAVVSCTDPEVQMVICFSDRNHQFVHDIEAFFRKRVKLREVPISRLGITGQSVLTVVRQKYRADTLRRARTLMSQRRGWGFFHFNSEHFATFAYKGDDFTVSTQVTNLFKHIQKDVAKSGLPAMQTTASIFLHAIKEGSEEVLKEVGDETLTAVGKLSKGAKVYFLPGILIEGTFCCYKMYVAYDQWSKEEISEEQFKGKVIGNVSSSGMSLACGSVGAAVGSVVIPIPVVGGFIGGAVGGMAGSYMGSRLGGAVAQALPGTQP